MSASRPSVSPEPIAIIGIGCRYPGGADTPDAFWQMMRNGQDCVTEVPESRWDVDKFYDPDPTVPDKANTRWGGFLSQVDQFDPQFFGIAPREVTTMDPQQRLLLEVTWEALEDAGHIPDTLRGSQTGVFIGIGTHDYSIMLWQQPVNDPYATTGTGNCIAANRISYLFDFKGPSLAVDTACSSSLVAVHLACQSLWAGESRVAIAGGVNVLLLPTVTAGFAKGGFMSSNGRCKSFDASADGYVRSEGAGLVVLKPLAQALADDDSIYAVIRGSAVNQDGCSQGMAAPSATAQTAVIQAAYRQANIDPTAVQYVEAHGTGTKLGDPIEAQALGAVLSPGRAADDVCLIGSVKTNIGHTETAAGVAGLIKAALMLKHREMPPSLHCYQPNPAINFEQLRLRVQTELAPLPKRVSQDGDTQTTYIGINSFGFGGTNAHVVLSDMVPERDKTNLDVLHPHLLVLSAKGRNALRVTAERYVKLLDEQSDLDVGELCAAASLRRSHFSHRLACVSESSNQLKTQLTNWLSEQETAGMAVSRQSSTADDVAFLFTGQGSQSVGMGKELYETQSVFREALNRCAEILKSYHVPLIEILYRKGPAEYTIDDTIYTQPVLFAFEYALAQLWQSWGIWPTVVMGHSLGEYVAACVAGVFSLEDGLRLIAERGRLMQALPAEGAMVSVMADVEQCRPYVEEYGAAIAAINSPQSTVISGTAEAIANLIQQFEAKGIQHKQLTVSHGFHSALMEPMLDEFRQVAESITFQLPTLPIISMLTGDLASDEIATADYWVSHVRQPVKCLDAVKTLGTREERIFLEIGAKPILLGMARSCLPNVEDIQWLPSLRPNQAEQAGLLTSLAALYTQGATINWAEIFPHRSGAGITLPTYPFQRQRYWWSGPPIPAMRPAAPVSAMAMSTDHPLIGQRLLLAGTTKQRYQSEISPQRPGYLKDHQVLDQVILPGAAYVEGAIAAACRWHNSEAITLTQVTIERPLTLSENSSTALQLVLTPGEQETGTVQVFSLNNIEDATFTRHATAGVTSLSQITAPSVSLASLQTSLLPYPVAVDSYYQALSEQGLNYGPHFRTIQQLWQHDDQSLSHLQMTDTPRSNAYCLHPTLLDGCFQTIGAAVKADVSLGTYLPVGIDQLHFYRPLRSTGWCWVRLQPPEQKNGATVKTLKANVLIWDDTGSLAAQMTGMTLQYVKHDALKQLVGTPKLQPSPQVVGQDWVYSLTWQPHTKAPQTSTTDNATWLLFTDTQGIGNRLATALREQGNRCFIIQAGEQYQASLEDNIYRLNPSKPDDFDQLFTDLLPTLIAEQQGKLNCQIGYLWALDTAQEQVTLVDQQQNCGGLLHLVLALAQMPALSARLWLITQATQAVEVQSSVQLQQMPLWGLARSLRLEQPHLACTCLDLPQVLTAPTWEMLLDDLCYPDNEDQIAYHQDNRFVARLVAPTAAASQPLLEIPKADSFRVGLTSYGVLDHLTLMPTERQAPQSGEVEIQVKAAGLNFRDVLNALGLLQAVAEAMGFATPEDVPFGGECAGVITAVGPDVTTLQVGDEVVLAQTLGTLSQFVTVPTDFLVLKPSTLDFAEAATVPTTFLTAYYGLVHCAQLKAGDRILIHSAAGGVGQAVVQIAQQIGAEIFATASPPKWSFLQSMGIHHVMNSRTLDFAEEILTITDGQGVDVVFNSLNGDFIDKSLEVLAPQGRFVEIGKIGVWEPEQMQAARPDVAYFPFDLLDISDAEPQLIANILTHLMAEFEAKTLYPLPKTVFPIEAAVDAFRYMAQARHVGKVVLTLPAIAPRQSLIHPNATYLVTGGLGALGLTIAQWLADQGTRQLILLSRRAPSEMAQQTIDQLQKKDVTVQVIQADVADLDTLKTVLSPLLSAKNSRPLKGIFHLAGTLADGLLVNQSWQQFNAVMAPKLTGAWNLHMLTQKHDLDHFVCFSSMVSLMGSLGQGNYAAANAFLDGFAQYRRSLGLPGLSLNWGPWADAGMVAQLDDRSQQRFTEQGLTPIPTDLGLQLMSQMMRQARAQVGIIPMDWAKFINSASGQASGASSPLLTALMPAVTETSKGTATNPEILQQLAKTSDGERSAILATYLQAQLAKVMGFTTADAIDPDEQFGDLGMDSLMAVEFTNRLQKNLNHPVSQTLAFDYPSINSLANYLVQDIAPVLPMVTVTESIDQTVPAPTTKGATPEVSPKPSPIVMHAPKQENVKTVIKEVPPRLNTPTYTPPPEHYQFSQMADYRRLRQDLDRVEGLGNPFFMVHGGTAKDTTEINGQSLINYSSYNYLGLSGDPRVNSAAQSAISQYGTSVSASRVSSGERPLHRQLEQGLAQFLGTEDCITYIGGHATNVTTIGHLFREKDLILYDALSHNSIREGCRLSGATMIEFPHNDWQALDQLLCEHRRHYEKVLVTIEGVYSTDGDLAPLPDFIRVKTAHKAMLLVDEAHSIGVLGKTGRGVGEHFEVVAASVDLWMGTLSKTFASCGGYIAGCAALVEYLKYTAPGFVFSVGMSPANAAAALESLRIIQQEPERVKQGQERSQLFLSLAKDHGLNTGDSHDSPVIPVIVGEPYKAVQLCHTLFQQGINVQPMVYPSVPYDAARLRFFVSSLHTEEQIRHTVQTIADELMILKTVAAT